MMRMKAKRMRLKTQMSTRKMNLMKKTEKYLLSNVNAKETVKGKELFGNKCYWMNKNKNRTSCTNKDAIYCCDVSIFLENIEVALLAAVNKTRQEGTIRMEFI
jgi:hypothetical protein